jgi:transcriptional regulator NrdR family protein
MSDTRTEAVEVQDEPGLQCPQCGCRHLPVTYTRPKPGGRIMRVRNCRHCGRRVVTFERVN